MTDRFDLRIRAGRIVCPTSDWDGPGEVCVRNGRIAAFGSQIDGVSDQTCDFPAGILLPGLIDLHAHPAKSGSKYGVDPDVHFLPRGVTTVLSQGDAGADNLDEYIANTILASRTRVLLAINFSRAGESMPGGCFENLDWADVDACVSAIERHRSHIWGIAVNVSEIACVANDPRVVLRRAVTAAETTAVPLLFGIHHPDKWSLREQLDLLRPGDVMTYCFRGGAHAIVDERGRVRPEVRAARQKGVLFDVGHGMGSFSFRVAESAIADGFPPDTISTDGYARHVGLNPIHDLPRTMGKLIAAGMPESHVFAAVTSRAAEILRMTDEIGRLAVDREADLTVLHPGPVEPLRDVEGESRPGFAFLPALTVRAGRIVANP